MPGLTRRRLLALAAAAATLPVAARAQGEFAYDGILPFVWDAHIVRDLVLLPDMGEEQTIHYVGRDFHSRTGLVAAAGLMGAIDTRAQAGRYLEGLSLVDEARFSEEALASQMSVIEELLGVNLPLIPASGSVQPVRLALVEPPPFIPPVDRAILARIVADTLEIHPEDLPDGETLVEAAEMADMLDVMLDATRDEDWQSLASASERLLVAAAAPARLDLLRGTARPRVLYNLAVGCVPLIGWTYMTARLVAGVRRNRHRFSFV